MKKLLLLCALSCLTLYPSAENGDGGKVVKKREFHKKAKRGAVEPGEIEQIALAEASMAADGAAPGTPEAMLDEEAEVRAVPRKKKKHWTPQKAVGEAEPFNSPDRRKLAAELDAAAMGSIVDTIHPFEVHTGGSRGLLVRMIRQQMMKDGLFGASSDLPPRVGINTAVAGILDDKRGGDPSSPSKIYRAAHAHLRRTSPENAAKLLAVPTDHVMTVVAGKKSMLGGHLLPAWLETQEWRTATTVTCSVDGHFYGIAFAKRPKMKTLWHGVTNESELVRMVQHSDIFAQLSPRLQVGRDPMTQRMFVVLSETREAKARTVYPIEILKQPREGEACHFVTELAKRVSDGALSEVKKWEASYEDVTQWINDAKPKRGHILSPDGTKVVAYNVTGSVYRCFGGRPELRTNFYYMEAVPGELDRAIAGPLAAAAAASAVVGNGGVAKAEPKSTDIADPE